MPSLRSLRIFCMIAGIMLAFLLGRLVERESYPTKNLNNNQNVQIEKLYHLTFTQLPEPQIQIQTDAQTLRFEPRVVHFYKSFTPNDHVRFVRTKNGDILTIEVELTENSLRSYSAYYVETFNQNLKIKTLKGTP